ncbi:MAG: hypothetical protein FWC20_00875 [Oscillospiraceae bacterium]|nr:hypothetical protein [Oscillospiraceae bacterium]MCL2277947.1 hypothetical protein [Oscillospiraceae bacterium]
MSTRQCMKKTISQVEMKILHNYVLNGSKLPRIGADPKLVNNALEHVRNIEALSRNYLPFKAIRAIDEPNEFANYLSKLPSPHMLFSDWRFNKKTRVELIKLLSYNEWSVSPHIAFICCPHLGVLFNILFPEIKISIYDINASIVEIVKEYVNENASVEACDVKSISHGCRFTSIIYDPPLYLSYYQAIIELSNHALYAGGNLYYVYPNSTLRSDFGERLVLQSMISKYNFLIENVYTSILHYDVPQFEKNTYMEIGVDCVIDWRNHQLYHLKKVEMLQLKSNEHNAIVFDPNDWEIYRFNKKTIALKTKRIVSICDDSKLEPQLASIYDDTGILLKSVSSRHKSRQYIDLWTSENIAYKVTNLPVIKSILDGYKQYGESISKDYIYNELKQKYTSGLPNQDSMYAIISQIKKIIGEQL